MSRREKARGPRSSKEDPQEKTPILDRLELETETTEICKGILLGLYGVRDEKAHEIIGRASDFPAETAADAALTWCAGGTDKKTVRRERAQLLQKFAKESTPEWEALIKRVLARA